MELKPGSDNQDLVIPAVLVAAVLLILPALQTQPWWLILPCLICLILRWQTLAFVLLFASMSYADSWATGIYYLGVSILLLMRMNSNPSTTSVAQLTGALRQVVLSLPLLAVIILLAAGVRWQDQRTSAQSMTGVNDTMTPGSVSELVNDGNLAMRVSFAEESPAPPRKELYWRGVVLENFDGQTWSRNSRLELDLDPIPDQVTRRLQYQVTLEPGMQYWLYGLHQAYTVRAQSYRDTRGMLVTSDMLRQRVRYPVTSIAPPAELRLDNDTRRRNLAVPLASNPRTRQWIGNLRSQYPDDHDFTAAILRHFGEQEFYYTLTPTPGAVAQIDDFMFVTREGFCEHYAGALTFILRAAGIPARVVVGYQGGDLNPITGHWTVYQYNAHAWVEAWYSDRGWQRLDPTTSVAPERINLGIDAWLASLNSGADSTLDRGIRQRLWLADIPGYRRVRDSLDAMQYSWNLGVYDSEGNLRTEDLNNWLTAQGLGNLPVWLLAMLLVFVGLRAMWSGRRHGHKLSPVMQEYKRLDTRLQKFGLSRRPSETITVHLERVGANMTGSAECWGKLGHEFSEAEYRTGMIDRRSMRQRIRRLLSRKLFRPGKS